MNRSFIAFIYALFFALPASSMNCEDTFQVTGQSPTLRPANLDPFFFKALTNQRYFGPSEAPTAPRSEYVYEGNVLKVRAGRARNAVTLGVSWHQVPADAVQTFYQAPGAELRRPLSVVQATGSRHQLYSAEGADILATVSTGQDGKIRTFRIAALGASIEAIAAADDGPIRTLYALAGSELSEISLPDFLPQTRPVKTKTFDLSPLKFKGPIVLQPYGRYLLLGGDDVAILDSRSQTLVLLRLPKVNAGRVVSLGATADGKIQVVRQALARAHSVGNVVEILDPHRF